MSDSNSNGGAHLLDAHFPNVDEVKSPRPRQAGSMLMVSARIEADANCMPRDPLTLTASRDIRGAVRTEAPEYMQRLCVGGEPCRPALGENSALSIPQRRRSDCAIEASRDRLNG